MKQFPEVGKKQIDKSYIEKRYTNLEQITIKVTCLNSKVR